MLEEEYIKRQKVWEAISNFYLDTELSENDYGHISKILLESKIELSELEAIDLYEVFPLLYKNLLSTAGEWAGFDSKWLNTECLRNFEKRKKSKSFRFWTKLKNKLNYKMRERHWVEIRKRMNTGQ